MNSNNIDFSFESLEQKFTNNSQPGSEIDYDPEFIELTNMVALKEDQQYGNTIIPASPIDWSRVLNKAYALLDKSKDYRICNIITRALTHKYGVKGTLKGIEAIYSLTEYLWQHAYPSLTFDGEIDFLPRANAIAELNSLTGLVGDLRRIEIQLGSAGKISINRLEKILSGRLENDDYSRDQILRIAANEAPSHESDITAIKNLLIKVSELEILLNQQVGIDQAPNLNLLKTLLISINLIPDNNPPGDSSLSLNVTVSETNLPSRKSQNDVPQVNSRDDAIRLLDKICNFLEANDPANPAPLLIKRARNMIGQDFYTILNQLVPDAVSQAEHITGAHS